MESSGVPFHMDNKGTLLQVHADPQSPRHGESTAAITGKQGDAPPDWAHLLTAASAQVH